MTYASLIGLKKGSRCRGYQRVAAVLTERYHNSRALDMFFLIDSIAYRPAYDELKHEGSVKGTPRTAFPSHHDFT